MDKTNALSLTGGGMFDGGWTPVWLIKDEFTDTRSAGSVNGTAATPGPGTRTVTDTGSYASVGDGVLDLDSGATSITTGNGNIAYGAVSRAAGVALLTKLKSAFYARIAAGFHTGASVGTSLPAIDLFHTNDPSGNRRTGGLGGLTPAATEYQYSSYAVVLRSTGALFFANDTGQWTTLWVRNTGSDATLYPMLQPVGTGFLNHQADYFRVIQLPAPFDTDDGLATDTHSGSVAAGTTFSHEADCLIEFTVTTLGVGDGTRVWIRSQDSNNYFYVYIGGGTGNFGLYEVVSGGTPVQRANLNSAVATGHRVVIIADGTTIKGYSNNTLSWTYSSATNFATATSGKLATIATGGAVSDLKTWPRTLSGTAASILNKVSA